MGDFFGIKLLIINTFDISLSRNFKKFNESDLTDRDILLGKTYIKSSEFILFAGSFYISS
ncbi:hypothetical protein BH23BAC1_BH23BAC1_11990 [soil metagenome]